MNTNLPLQTSTPEAQGISSTALLAFIDTLEQNIDGIHSVMLLRHGYRVGAGWWSPYAHDQPHMLFSVSKSFTSSAIGLAIAEGRLSLDDPVISFFPADAPTHVSNNLASMQVRHLLSMSSGHAVDTLSPFAERPSDNWISDILAQPVDHQPGTQFVYNSGASYLLSAIVQQVSGMRVLDYLQPRLFAPLGIDYASWETCPRGIDLGGWGLSITTKAIARFGQLYLQQGMWHGERLLPAAWVAEATACQVANGASADSDWEQGYAFQFWRCRHDAYRADGACGQFCVIMPAQDAVLAMTAGTDDTQTVLNIVWEQLLPAMQPTPLPENSLAHAQLQQKLAQLSLPSPQGQSSVAMAARVSGRTFVCEPNQQYAQSLMFNFNDAGAQITLQDSAGNQHQVVCGSKGWHKGATTMYTGTMQQVAASGAWTTPDTYTVQICFYHTPFCPTLSYRFADDQVLVDLRSNVAFGPPEPPQLVAHINEG